MGRGRQKAKATKQAREIKYFTPNTDLSALERELAQSRGDSSADDLTSYESEDESYGYDDLSDRYGR
ncbi:MULTISPECIES: DUF3073 domain-containing protein [Actinomycetes]|uniref:DUF3073 domain-containing protein n=2 Tax=Actinomycetes TaxID=1760 RepID=A0ABP6LY34_9MICC|nr:MULTISPECIES: DUF3073 domain-containing protein [unclassified Nesterenkonia]MDS2172853.1 DUF3073 domain-containing protein [Nesterenkonia sp. CL21]OSM44055.1 hypothetical protein BCY76_004250 [Nesterenkonia sp. PF2B19]